MLKIENVVLPSAEQWEAIIRGMRNPKNSWDKMDSGEGCPEKKTWTRTIEGPFLCDECEVMYESKCVCMGERQFIIGPNDKQLMTSLANGGPVHAKYRRMIPVYLDITAPLYWWKEFDTYKLGTVANSCSTMHKIHAKEFTLKDFSTEHLMSFTDVIETPDELLYCEDCDTYTSPLGILADTITALNLYRERYLETNDKKYWWQMIQLLPTSYNQKRTVMLNYEVLVNIYKWRKNHRLDEWHAMCSWIESLPYSELITGEHADVDKDA